MHFSKRASDHFALRLANSAPPTTELSYRIAILNITAALGDSFFNSGNARADVVVWRKSQPLHHDAEVVVLVLQEPFVGFTELLRFDRMRH